MKNKLATVAAVLCTALPSLGFIKAESKSAINKDGSARFTMIMEIDLAGPMAMMGAAGGKNPLGDGREVLVQMVKGMNANVDVWSDAKAETTKGGATRVTLSGFTKDWLAMGDLKKALAASGGASPVPIDELPDLKFMDQKTDSAGNSVITMAGLDDICTLLDAARKMAIKKGENPGEMNVDEAEISQGLAQARAQWPGIKGFAAPLVKGISLKSEIQVCGTISETEVFKKTSENSATYTLTGDQILSLADQIIADEELPGKIVKMVESIKANFENEKSVQAVRTFLEPYVKEVYGGAVNPKIVFKTGADVFDYAAETEKAKAAQSDELKALVEEAGKAGGKVKLPGSGAPAPGKKSAE
jgi:hypothetical protein